MLLACGWIFFSPPIHDSRDLDESGKALDVYDINQPLSKWRQEKAFDTAEACERYRDSEKSDLADQAARHELLKIYLMRLMMGYVLGRCIPSDSLNSSGK